MITKLTETARDDLLQRHPQWQYVAERDAVRRNIEFGDFAEAFAFMTRVAILAEKMDHHPEWSNIYNRVEILWTTHDCDGLSENDVAMVEAIDNML